MATTTLDTSQIQQMKEYKWFNSNSLAIDLQCGILRLDLPDEEFLDIDELPDDLSVSVYLVSSQIPLNNPALMTLFHIKDLRTNSLRWDQVLSFPIKIRDLTLDALLVFTIYTVDGQVYGGSTMRLFDDNGCLKQGKQKLLFYPDQRGDPNVIIQHNDTPGELYDSYFANYDMYFRNEKEVEKYRYKKYFNNSAYANQSNQAYYNKLQAPKEEWLDRLFLQRVNQMNNMSRQSMKAAYANPSVPAKEYNDLYLQNHWGQHPDALEILHYSFLVIELPLWPYPVLYEEKQYTSVDPHIPPTSLSETLASYVTTTMTNSLPMSINDDSFTGPTSSYIEFSLIGRPFQASWLTIIADWDMDQENLSEEQNRRLLHNVRRGNGDSAIKPNKDEKKRLDQLISSVATVMKSDDLDFLYRFRYTLTENKKALIKFLYTVNWDEENEVEELPILLNLWKERAPIDVADALKLLSKEKSFEHPYVREYAVEILRSASDEELLTFLLQLVQALRYEPNAMAKPYSGSGTAGGAGTSGNPPATSGKRGSLQSYVDLNSIETASMTTTTSTNPDESTVPPAIPSTTSTTMLPSLDDPTTPRSPDSLPPVPVPASAANIAATNKETLSPLGNFLIDRACISPIVANYLFWYLKVEIEDEVAGSLFQTIFEYFIIQLSQYNEESKSLFKRLCVLDDYINKILACQRDAREEGKRKEGKEIILRQLLDSRKLTALPSSIEWIPMPLDPKIRLSGLISTTASMFASAVYPCVIEFTQFQPPSTPQPPGPGTPGILTTVPKTHKIMFKSGDDLRQDQLIMQMISLMDSLLKKVNLDLKLLTYGILAVSQKDGIMEFVRNSMPISGVLKTFGSITEYFKHHCYDKNGPYEVSPTCMDTYVKSCAGYCVITYILGIGDRHLDNIMLNTSGQLFHIDFGFIFGQDPKPFPPPFRFTRSMADAMGGEDSEYYNKFKTYCCQSYNWLRKSANLILNLLSLMGDAGINDISKRSELSKVLQKVEEKFRLDLTDEQAEQYFLELIKESLHSLAPKVMELAHKIAVSMR